MTSIPKAYFFDQKLDHFDHQDMRTWKQRYFVNDTYWQPGGPIFLQIGGEGAISPLYVLTMEYVEYAKASFPSSNMPSSSDRHIIVIASSDRHIIVIASMV